MMFQFNRYHWNQVCRGRRLAVLAAGLLLIGGLLCAATDVRAQARETETSFDRAVAAYDAGDYRAAYALWLDLARAGDPAAQRNVAHLFRHGLGVEQSFTEAANWYRRAAELGLAAAQVNLATMQAKGQGAEQSYENAAYWYHEAALQGHVLAQYNLGLMYAKGLGVTESEPRAIVWLHRAAKGGHKKAIEQLARLIPEYDPEIGPPSPPLDSVTTGAGAPKPSETGTVKTATEESVGAELPPTTSLAQLPSVDVAAIAVPKAASPAQPNRPQDAGPPFWRRMWSFITPFSDLPPQLTRDAASMGYHYPDLDEKGGATFHSNGLMPARDLTAESDRMDVAAPENWTDGTLPPAAGAY